MIELPAISYYQPDEPSSAYEWESRRSTLCHDKLDEDKSGLIGKMDGLIKTLLDGPSDQSSRTVLKAVVDENFSNWPKYSREAQVLIDTYPSLLTPRTLIEEPPLSRLDQPHKDWIGEVTHALWQARYEVKDDVRRAKEALDKANTSYEILSSDLETVETVTVSDLKRLRPVFQSFRDAGSNLLNILRKDFCHKLKVT